MCNKEVYEFETGNININNVSHIFQMYFESRHKQFDRNLVDDWLNNFDNLIQNKDHSS